MEIIKLVFFDGLYKFKFGVVYRHQKTLDFNSFLVIFFLYLGKIPFLMKRKYGIIPAFKDCIIKERGEFN